MTNASFLYYRYYGSKNFGKDLDQKTFGMIIGQPGVTAITPNLKINDISYSDYYQIGTESFRLKTTYPGLIIGSGYTHPALEQGDFEMGFYFDHTTGLPVIPGSTVKGILKSVFPKEKDNGELRDEKISYVNGKIEKIGVADIHLNNSESSINLLQKLFEKGNIFYDAYISAIPAASTNPKNNGKIFAEDYITPHHPGEEMGMFKNPIPIRFLKIAPGVTFTFQFKLKGNYFGGIELKTSEKLDLFKKIILDFGIGAKRNVGYGNLIV